MAIRLGAVGYLNARPLVHGLTGHGDSFEIRFDVPARCAELLHANQVDLGLIPSIEYLHAPDYRIVPGIAIASNGPVASVALYTRVPTQEIRSIAIDSGSRTSVALLRVLCAQWFDIAPKLVTLEPDLPAMMRRCDAALLIGDAALFAEHDALGLEKIDLGEEWRAMTNLPFVYAFWAGRPGVVSPEDARVLREARDAGVAAVEEVSRQYFEIAHAGTDDTQRAERARRGAAYLRDNVRFGFGEAEAAGLRKFYDAAVSLGVVPMNGEVQLY